MGGQACVLYGGAEFSRDADIAVIADNENLGRLGDALDELQAKRIAVPPFERQYLDMGLAVHFRCQHPEAAGIRIDVMSKMRGVDDVETLWERRTTVDMAGETIELLSLPDLVQAKKTQREKDWPMITRLLEANYFENRGQPTKQHVCFWLRELRTPALLIDVAADFPSECDESLTRRDLLRFAKAGNRPALERSLEEEKRKVQEADRLYWRPLREELARLRRMERRP